MEKVLFIVGPTAVGKTEYAIRLAQDLDGEIVSADSMQIYKYMDIGSAKPTKEERDMVKHYLVDEIDPKTPFSAADYQKLAKSYIKQIQEGGRLPIVCGGTGLYVNALLYDMDFGAPEGNKEYRDKLASEYSAPMLHQMLRELDQTAAEQIHPNNVKRMVRAIERLQSGEKTLAAFSDVKAPAKEYESVLIGLTRDRQELYDRIGRRVQAILAAGLEGEVQGLMDMGFTEKDIAMKGIGYKEVIAELKAGRCAEDAAATIVLNTRHYARRQLIWFRRYEQLKWVTLNGDSFDEAAYAELKAYAEKALYGREA